MQHPDTPARHSGALTPPTTDEHIVPEPWVDLVYEPPPRRAESPPDAAIPEITLRRTNPHGVAAVAAREAREAARLAAEARVRAAERATRWRRLGPFVALSVLLAWTLREPAPVIDPMPEALVGTWTTTHPDYRDRTLVIGPGSVQIGHASTTAPVDAGPWPIEALSVRAVGDASAISLAYRTVGGRVFLNAALDQSGPPVLRLAQPEGVAWRRVAPDEHTGGAPRDFSRTGTRRGNGLTVPPT